MPASSSKSVLILGGTGEGRGLAEALVAAHGAKLRVISSLAGATPEPRRPAGELRIGGFGGGQGLAEYLQTEKIDLVVDATHPFAATISKHASEASEATGVPMITVLRPPWTPIDGDRWINVANITEAVREISARSDACLLTTGVKDLAAFAPVVGVKMFVRLMTAPDGPVPLVDAKIIVDRPPFRFDDEIVLFRELGIDTLVSKNAGGDATRAKIDAARRLGILVVMIGRPKLSISEAVGDIDAALALVAVKLNL